MSKYYPHYLPLAEPKQRILEDLAPPISAWNFFGVGNVYVLYRQCG